MSIDQTVVFFALGFVALLFAVSISGSKVRKQIIYVRTTYASHKSWALGLLVWIGLLISFVELFIVPHRGRHYGLHDIPNFVNIGCFTLSLTGALLTVPRKDSDKDEDLGRTRIQWHGRFAVATLLFGLEVAGLELLRYFFP